MMKINEGRPKITSVARLMIRSVLFFNDTATTEIYTPRTTDTMVAVMPTSSEVRAP